MQSDCNASKPGLISCSDAAIRVGLRECHRRIEHRRQAQLQLFCALRFLRVLNGHVALNALHLGNDASSSSFLLRPTKVSAAPFLKHRPSAFAAVLARPQFDASGVSNARMQTAWPSQAMTVTDRYK
jgi:PRC-barrel domain